MLIEAEIFDFEKEKRKRRTPEDREKEDMELAQSAVSGDSEDDWVYDVEGEIELLMRGIESGKVVDLADSDPFDDDPMNILTGSVTPQSSQYPTRWAPHHTVSQLYGRALYRY